LAARTCGKSATYGVPAFFETEDLLVWSRACADEKNRTVWQAEMPGERSGDQIHLIVAALAFTLPVKGYWNHEVGFDSLLAGEVSEAIGEPPAQRLDLLKLQ
jgi:hypothetical protein